MNTLQRSRPTRMTGLLQLKVLVLSVSTALGHVVIGCSSPSSMEDASRPDVPSPDGSIPDGSVLDGSMAADASERGDVSRPDGSISRPDASGVEVPPSAWANATGNLAHATVKSCRTPTLVVANPHSTQVVVGLSGVGLWATSDRGETWRALGGGSGSANINNRPRNVLFDPLHPNTFWEVGSYADGLFRTDDGGDTFVRLGDFRNSHSLGIDFTDPDRNTLLVTTRNRQNELYLSTNAGVSWENVASSSPNATGGCGSTYVVGAGTFLLACSGIHRSTDRGRDWTRVANDEVGGVFPATNGDLYWPLRFRGLLRSQDGGASFSDLEDTHGFSSSSLTELPDGRVVLVGADSLYASNDRGASWDAIGETLPYQAGGVTYSSATKSFYIWPRVSCTNMVGEDVSLVDDAVMSAGFDWEAE